MTPEDYYDQLALTPGERYILELWFATRNDKPFELRVYELAQSLPAYELGIEHYPDDPLDEDIKNYAILFYPRFTRKEYQKRGGTIPWIYGELE